MRNLAPPTLLWLIVALGVAVPHPTSAQPLDTDAVDRAVQEIMGRIGIPGVALAVVRRHSVEHLRGYSVREVGTDQPVGAGTRFAIGSATKAFTATLVGMFEEEGRLEWDDPVVEHLPSFALSEPFPTATITLRDLLAHRSGLPAADLMWLPTHHPPHTLIDRLGHLEPVAGFRSRFTYQNILYVVAGQILERVSGSSWEELLEERLLAPLEMQDTNTSMATLTGRADVASPHVRSGGQAIPVPYRRVDDVAPAGAINSSARDLARWLRLLLAERETPDGRRLIHHGDLVGTLEHWHFDTFQVTWQDLAWQATVGPGWVTFRLHRSGAVEGLTLEALPGDTAWLTRRN